MKRRFFLFGVLLISVCVMQLSCFSVPHLIWPQKDIKISEVNEPALEKKVLVASRSSEFKDAVVKKIKEAFKGEQVYMKFIGVELLEKEKAADYDAIVMINTCMSRNMDRNVKGFLKRHEDQSNMIVLTTSGGGDWMPKMKERNFDAISAASKKEKLDEVAGDIVGKIRILLQKPVS